MTRTIAITGATGFIGQGITAQLLADGHRVRALVRSEQRASQLPDAVHRVTGDLATTPALHQLVDGADVVIHCAGAVRGATRADFDTTNVDGLNALVDAISGTGNTPYLCLLSSLAAREPGLSYYSASKLAAEQVLLRHYDPARWLALRPPAVYGPGDRELLPLFKSMARGFAPVPGARTARFSMIFVADIAGAIAQWISGHCSVSGVFEIDDGKVDGYDWRAVADIAARICDRESVHVIEIPHSLLDFAARANLGMAKIFRYLPMLTPSKLNELRHTDWVSDSHELQERLSWHPVCSLADGLRNTPGWCGK